MRVPDELWKMILVEAAKEGSSLGEALLVLVKRSNPDFQVKESSTTE